MAIYLKGDVHGELIQLTNFIDRFNLGADDKIIVLGDMGLYWRNKGEDARAFIEYYEQYYTTHIYFIDGNHDNFKLINKLDGIEDSDLKYCSDHIHYIPRGTLFVLEGKTFLACGGADSIDKFLRMPGLTWWREEQITETDVENSIAAAKSQHIDYVLTHCCPISVFKKYAPWLITLTGIDQSGVDHTSEERLEEIMNNIDFDKWYFGHYHIDKQLDDKFTCLLNDFIQID